MRKAKSIVISVLLAACAACLAFALVGCGKKEKTATKYGYGEEGVYYYDATGSSTRYMLNLYGGSYMLAMDDVMTSAGTYSFDEDTRAITFSGSDEKFSAGVAENVLSMDFTDSGYTFLRYVYFDVTFRNADGTVLATQQVLNGKAAEPEDCSLEGYYFIDWYGDAALSTAYGFNTSVTADTDIYGWYVEKNPIATDFWVTYDFGDGVVAEPIRTQNGTIYALPTAENLMGWWQSDTNNGAELTRKYEAGTVLDSDTTLFAVYDSGNALGASVTNSMVTWENAVGATVTVTIYSENEQVFTTSAPSSNMRTSIGELGTGTYTVVVESGSAIETLVYVVNGLARVSGFEILNGTVISFNPVENATGYTIEISNGVRTETIDLGNSTVYNISGWEMTAEGLTFAVTAHAAGYADSVSNTHNYTAKLEKIVISIADDTVTWNTVENATSYEVEITVNGLTERFATYYTSISLKNYNLGDEITVTVKPVASGYYSEATTSSTYKKVSLAAPVIENVLNGVITWSGVEGATGYSISINGEIITLNGGDVTNFATSDSNFIDGQGTYTVMVRALGEGSSSAFSDAVVITEKDMGETLAYENGTVSWQYSFAASSYIVQVNNENETIVTYGNTAKVTFTKAGDNEITVYFLDENGEKSAAASITIFAYEVILDAREDGTVSTDVLYVAMGDAIILPDAVSSDRGLTFDAWYTLPDYSPEGYGYSGKGVKMENGTVFTGSSAIFLYAYYTPAEFTITISYTVNDVAVTEEYSVYYKRPFNLPVIEGTGENEGMMFAGWYSDVTTRNQVADYTGYGASYAFVDDVTLYAGWYNYLTYTRVDIDGDTTEGYAVSKGVDIGAIPTNEITIPSSYKGLSIVQLQSNAFRNCTWITTLNIPDTVTYIALVNNGYASGTGAFAGCSGLKNVNIYSTGMAQGIVYYSEDGVLFEYNEETDETALVYYPWARSGSYVMPETVSNENEYAYSGGTEVKVVRTVDAIANQVFVSNTKLTAITIPATVSTIYAQAFYGCTKLTKVTFLEDDSGADPSLFMENNVFQNCTALTNVTLPSHMIDFDPTVFSGCSSLKALTITKEGGNYTTRDGYLCNSTGTEILYCAPGRSDVTITDVRITTIGESVFSGITSIQEVVIPEWVTTIGARAFYGCTGLTTLAFMGTVASGSLTIKTMAFYGCTALTEVTLPANLKTLGANAFGGCSKLTYVGVYTDYEMFGNPNFATAAFGTNDRTSTFYVTDLFISERTGVMDIAGVFGAQLSKIVIEGIDGNGSNEFYAIKDDVIYNYNETELIFFPDNKEEFVSSESLLSINNSAFRGKTNLKSVVIGAKVETIADYAFYGCSYLTSVTFAAVDNMNEMAEELVIGDYAFASCVNLLNGAGEKGDKSMILPSNLVSIGDFAFYDCRQLTEITIPKATSRIGLYEGSTHVSIYHVFDECSNLAKINVEDGNGSFWSYDGVLYSATKNILYYTPMAHVGSVEFVNDELELAIEQIWAYAFNNCTYLTSVEIPSTVTYIAANAFYNCSALTNITVSEEGETLTLEEGTSQNYAVFSNLTSLTTVTMTDRVTSIPAYTFYGDTKLTSIYIPAGTSEMAPYTFYNCTSLSTITVSQDAEIGEIGDYALYGTAISTFAFNEGLEKIGDYSFYSTKLTEIEIPSTTAYVGNYAFQKCTSLKKISFAEYTGNYGNMTVTIGNSCFRGCTALEEVGFPSVSTVLGGGVFYDAKITNSAGGDGNGNTWSKIELPGTIIEMGSTVFGQAYVDEIHFAEDSVIETMPSLFESENEQYRVKYVNVPKSVKYLGSAFYWGWLLEVTFDEGCQVETIGKNCFTNCSITSIVIPASVIEIGDSAFSYSMGSKLVTLGFEEGSKLEYIGASAFSGQGITELSLPESTSPIEIGTAAFGSCTSLTSAYISSSVVSMDTPFKGCYSLKNVEVAAGNRYFVAYEDVPNMVFEYVNGEEKISFLYGVQNSSGVLDLSQTNLTTIEYGWFNGDTSINTLILPDTLETIEGSAFYGCRNIASITMPSCVKIGDEAFRAAGSGSYNTALTSIEFPANLESIGDYAFYNYRNLATVTFAEGCKLKTIGAYAFSIQSNNSSYAPAFTTVTLPSGLEGIGEYAFQRCIKLETMSIPDSVTYMGEGVFYGCTALKTTKLSSGMTAIPAYLFYNCSALTTADIAWSQIKEVGTYALYGCSSIVGLTANMFTALETVGAYAFQGLSLTGELSMENITSIGTRAFESTKITKVTIGANLTDIGDGAFTACSSLKEIVVDENNKAFYSYKGMLFDATKCLICCPGGYTEDVEFTENEITGLAERAFNGCLYIKKIDLPINVTEYPSLAFQNCQSLKDFTFCQTVTMIGQQAFRYCYALQEITIQSSVTYMGTYAFQYCTGATTLSFADGCSLTSIPAYAFSHCESLESLTLPETIETLDKNAFEYCYALESVTFSEGLVETGDWAFYYCTSLNNVVLPSSFRTPGERMFGNCTSLSSITLNEGIEIINDYMFDGCTSLMELFVPTTVTEFKYGAFYNNSVETLIFSSSVKSFGSYAFRYSQPTTIYYMGTAEDWMSIGNLSSNGGGALSARRYYYSITGDKGDGNDYWHYVDQDSDGVYDLFEDIVIWEKPTVTSASLSPEALELTYMKGGTADEAELTLSVVMSNGIPFAGEVTWMTSDASVATVDGNGLSAIVRAVSALVKLFCNN